MNACRDYAHTIQQLRTRRGALGGLARYALASLSASMLPGLRPRLAFGEEGTARDVLVCIFLRGGADGLSLVAPYGDGATYYGLRPTLALAAPSAADPRAGLRLDDRFALHPSLAGLKQLYDAGTMAVVQATGSISSTRSHFDAMRFMEQATPDDRSVNTGWIARHLAGRAVQSASPLRAVGFGGSIPFSLRGMAGVNPIAVDDLDAFGLNADEDQAVAMQTALEAMYGVNNPSASDILAVQSRLCFASIRQLGALDAESYVPAHAAVYPENSDFAFGLRQTAQVIKAGLGLEVACLDLDGWDTHENAGTNDGYLRDLLKELGDSLSAFVQDLGPEEMARVTVVTMSEFGRRAEENASRGADHGHGNVMFALGGGVNGGRVYGEWPGLEDLDDGDLRITTDQRRVLAELLRKRMGNTAPEATFPHWTVEEELGIFRG